MKTESPDIVVVAHNGIKFDFPFLLSECYRAQIPLDFFAKLNYVDTLSMVRAADGQLYGGCMKLQCMFLHLGERGEGASLRDLFKRLKGGLESRVEPQTQYIVGLRTRVETRNQ